MRTLSINELSMVAGGNRVDGDWVTQFIDGPPGDFGVSTGGGSAGEQGATTLGEVRVTANVLPDECTPGTFWKDAGMGAIAGGAGGLMMGGIPAIAGLVVGGAAGMVGSAVYCARALRAR